MAQVLIFLAPGYEEVEMLTVVDMLRRADITIDMVSVSDTREVISSHNVTITADKLLGEVDFTEADMLILPGGIPGTPNLRACQTLCDQLIAFEKEGKWLAAVCAAPTVLGTLGLLKERRATCYPGQEDSLYCKEYVKQPVIIDNHIITSRGMGTCIEFSAEIIAQLLDRKTAEEVKNRIIYQDQYDN